MTNELKPFTAGDLAANLQGKIRTVIADSLPEEAINELINNEIKSFFQPQKENYYSDRTKDSKFKELVSELVKQEMATRIQHKFTPLLNTYWGSVGEAQFGVELEEIVKKLAPAFMESYFKSMAASMISAMYNNRTM